MSKKIFVKNIVMNTDIENVKKMNKNDENKKKSNQNSGTVHTYNRCREQCVLKTKVEKTVKIMKKIYRIVVYDQVWFL